MQADTWPLPDETDDLAELGPPLAEFKAGGRRLLLYVLGAPLMFLLGWVLALGPFFLFARGRGGGGLGKVIGLGLLLVASAVVLTLRGLRNRGLRVLVYPEGLVRLQRGRARAVLWEEVAAVVRSRTDGLLARLTQNSVSYTVRRYGGEELHFDEYLPDLEGLGTVLRRETLPHLLGRARAVYEAGGKVDFEKVTVSRAGLGDGKEELPWDEVKEVALDGQSLTVRRQGRRWHWLKAPLAEVPNVHVFRALVQPQLGARLTGGDS